MLLSSGCETSSSRYLRGMFTVDLQSSSLDPLHIPDLWFGEGPTVMHID
jgi:hypothetical protein